MKKILFLLVACCAGLFASAQTIYQPSGTSSFTGANTYCVGAPITTPLSFTYTTCNSGSGVPTGASCLVSWYYNTTNSTAITGSTVAVVLSMPVSTATAATGTLNYTPSLSVGGNYYFFCVINWTGGTSACGGATGSITSATTQLVRISPPPIAPTAPINICNGNNIFLTNAFAGGTWTSANPGVVTIDTFTGSAVGMSVGGSFITYTLGGCYVTAFMYVNANPAPIAPISATNICVGGTANLTNTTSGGTWISTVPANATIGSSSGVVSAFAAGTTTISYIITATGCFATKNVTVLPNPAAITGNMNVCVAGTTLLSDATALGTWSSSAPIRASINSGGLVTGNSAGTARITYTLPTGCFALTTVTVNTPPTAITGPSQVCATNNITLGNTITGGTWTSSNLPVATVGATSGIVSGLTVGTSIISYTTSGCAPATKTVTVNPLPGTISGVFFTCYGQSTSLSSSVSGGIWKSSDTTIATVDSVLGIVSGLSMGVTTITYKVVSGCYTTQSVTVYPLAPILGSDTVCVGSTSVLTNIVGGGTWVSSNPDNAAIDTFTGIIHGLVDGVTFVAYHLPSGCITQRLIKVIPPLPPIGGPLVLCSNSIVTLSNGVTGGTWSTSNVYVAEVDATTGKVSGHAADTAIITYKVFGCSASDIVTVNGLPTPTLTFDWTIGKLSTQSIYVAYQWFDSTHGAIAGATNSSIILPAVHNNYYVVVTDANGCSAPTEWFKLPLGIENMSSAAISIYPNPATSVLNIDAPQNTKIVISGIEGRSLIEAKDVKQVNISSLSPGIYIVNMYDSAGQILAVKRLIKE